MTYDYPSYYSQFHCIGGSCPDSCCIGWEKDPSETDFAPTSKRTEPTGTSPCAKTADVHF